MGSDAYYEPAWVDECDDPSCDHDDECTFCWEPEAHCNCLSD